MSGNQSFSGQAGVVSITGTGGVLSSLPGALIDVLRSGDRVSVSGGGQSVSVGAALAGFNTVGGVTVSAAGNGDSLVNAAVVGATFLAAGSNDTIASARGANLISVSGGGNLLSLGQDSGDTVVAAGSNNTIDGGATIERFASGSAMVSGNANIITLNEGAITVIGSGNTLVDAGATRVVIEGDDNTLVVPAEPGVLFPTQGGPSPLPGAAITVMGANNGVISYQDNTLVTVAGGAGNTVSFSGDGNTVTSAAPGVSVTVPHTDQTVSLAGANSSVSLLTMPGSADTGAPTVPTLTGAQGAIVAGGGTVTITAAVAVNLTQGGTTIAGAGSGAAISDSVGGNRISVDKGNALRVTGQAADTVTVASNALVENATVAGAANVVDLGTGSWYVGGHTSGATLNFAGGNSGGLFFAGDGNTINATGVSGLYVLTDDYGLIAGGGAHAEDASTVSLGGVDTLNATANATTITAAAGATAFVNGNANVLNGAGIDAVVQGTGNRIAVTGSDTVSLVTAFSGNDALSVQGGAFQLAGGDTLVQSAGDAAITLAGGNRITLGGGADTVLAANATGAGDGISRTGAGSLLFLGTAGASATIGGGAGGNATLVAGGGAETIAGSGAGAALYEITGGGGSDLLANFKGTLSLAGGLSTVSAAAAPGGSLALVLNDGTHLTLTGLAGALAQRAGGLFTAG